MKLNSLAKKRIFGVCAEDSTTPAQKTSQIMSILFPNNNDASDGTPDDDDQKLNDPHLKKEDKDYLAGFWFGKQYVEYMLNHNGMKPHLDFDVPNVDRMRIKALYESVTDFDPDNMQDWYDKICEIIIKEFDSKVAAQEIIDLVDNIVSTYNPNPDNASGGNNINSPFELDPSQQNQQNNNQSQQNNNGQQSGQQSGQQQNGQPQSGSDPSDQGGSKQDGESGSEPGGESGGESGKEQSKSGDPGSDSGDSENRKGANPGEDRSDSGNLGADGNSPDGYGNDNTPGEDGTESGGGNPGNGGSSSPSKGSGGLSDEDYDEISEIAESKFGGDNSVTMTDTGDDNGDFSGTHTMSKEEGDKIAEEMNLEDNSSSYGDDMDEDDVNIAGKLFRSLAKINHKKGVDTSYGPDGPAGGVMKQLKADAESEIDWREELSDFVTSISATPAYRHFRKNLAARQEIYAKNIYQDEDSMEKAVLYLDTSGSAIGFVEKMISEISVILQDNEFESVDVRLFHDKVYDGGKYVNLDPADLVEGIKKFKIDSGGTSLDAVYDHIYKNYTSDGTLNDDISIIMILSDVSGISGTRGEVRDNGLEDTCTERMFYLIYDDTANSFDEVDDVVKTSIDSTSRYIIMCLKNLELSIGVSMNESLVLPDDFDLEVRADSGEDVSAELSLDRFKTMNKADFDARLRKLKIDDARTLGDYEMVFEKIVSSIKENLSEIKPVYSKFDLENSENSYYINDDGIVSVHMNLTNENFKDFISTCKDVKYDKLVGNVNIDDISVENFPENFPVEIDGDFRIHNVKGLTSLKNFPKNITGEPILVLWSVFLYDEKGNRINTQKAIKEYLISIKKWVPDYISRYTNII